MNLIARHLCRICGDKEELERCNNVLSIAIMSMGHTWNRMNELNAMAQPMMPFTSDASNPYRQYQSALSNPYGPCARPVGLTGQHSPMYQNTLPILQWCDDSQGHKSLDVAVVTGDIGDVMFLVEPVLEMFKGLKAAYRSTSPMLNDFTIIDDDNIFDEELYVWGNNVSEEQLKSFSAKLASMVIKDKKGSYTFQGIPMKYSDLADDLKITNIPEGIGIMRYHRITRQQRAEEAEQRRNALLQRPADLSVFNGR